MLINDLLFETGSALIANKVRTGLTTLGIIIGIGSVIALVAVGSGTQASVEQSFSSLGSNLLTVMPGSQRSGGGMRGMVSGGRGATQTLTMNDAEAISELPGILEVSPESSSRKQMTSSAGYNTNATVMGATVTYLTVHNVTISEGDFISERNQQAANKVIVLGPTLAEDLFGEETETPIGETVRVGTTNFKIIGILAAKGGSGSSTDEMAFIPLSAMQRYVSGGSYISTISVSATDKDSTALAKSAITEELLVRHDVTSDAADFYVQSLEDVMSAVSDVTGTFTMLLACIAGISLVVGGIGIMNMMLTTVTERTREIGLKKALGASSRDISSQFLLEAILLTFAGGAGGLALGWGAAKAYTYFTGSTAVITLGAVLLAVITCATIGIVFGYYPARRAASLRPIEALRHE